RWSSGRSCWWTVARINCSVYREKAGTKALLWFSPTKNTRYPRRKGLLLNSRSCPRPDRRYRNKTRIALVPNAGPPPWMRDAARHVAPVHHWRPRPIQRRKFRSNNVEQRLAPPAWDNRSILQSRSVRGLPTRVLLARVRYPQI